MYLIKSLILGEISMSKIFDIIISILLNMFILLIWVYKMIITGDIPVKISFYEVIIIFILLILFLVIYSIYIKYTKFQMLNKLLLLIPLLLWFMSMQQALTYNYHNNDTLVSIMGFFIALIAFLKTTRCKSIFKNYK